MLLGLGTTVGRIVFGRIIDCKGVNKIRLHQMAMVVTGTLTAAMPLIKDYEGLIAYACINGLSDGCFTVLLPVVTFSLVGTDQAVMGWGFLVGFNSLTFTLGPVVAGLIRDKLGKYDVAFHLGGGMVILCAIMLLVIEWLRRRESPLPPPVEEAAQGVQLYLRYNSLDSSIGRPPSVSASIQQGIEDTEKTRLFRKASLIMDYMMHPEEGLRQRVLTESLASLKTPPSSPRRRSRQNSVSFDGEIKTAFTSEARRSIISLPHGFVSSPVSILQRRAHSPVAGALACWTGEKTEKADGSRAVSPPATSQSPEPVRVSSVTSDREFSILPPIKEVVMGDEPESEHIELFSTSSPIRMPSDECSHDNLNSPPMLMSPEQCPSLSDAYHPTPILKKPEVENGDENITTPSLLQRAMSLWSQEPTPDAEEKAAEETAAEEKAEEEIAEPENKQDKTAEANL